MNPVFRSSALALVSAWSVAALAADVATDAIQSAYAPYRAALFRTNGKSQPEAQQALAQAQQSWKGVVERFAAKPPVPYDADAEFASTLSQVSLVYDKAAGQVNAGKLNEAHDTLEAVRDLIAGLRQRNGVVVYSDHMNAYHAEMEHLLIDGPKILAGPQGVPLLTAQAGVLEYLSRQLRAQAPATLQRNAEFDALLKEVEASVQDVKKAAVAQDAAAIKDAMSKLKAPYSRLFLKFG